MEDNKNITIKLGDFEIEYPPKIKNPKATKPRLDSIKAQSHLNQTKANQIKNPITTKPNSFLFIYV